MKRTCIQTKSPLSIDRAGFTLIELVLVIVLVGLFLPPLLSPFLQSARETATPANIFCLVVHRKGKPGNGS